MLHFLSSMAMHGDHAGAGVDEVETLSKKISKVQREVLTHMAQGHRLFASSNSNWLDKVTRQDSGLYKRVHTNTLLALRKRGYIICLDTARTSWWRTDYEITDKGRKCLTNAA